MSFVGRAVAFTVLLFALPSSPAYASPAAVRECFATGAATFTPRLTTTFVANGSVAYTYRAICAVEYASGATGTESYTSNTSYSYTGSCISAMVVNPVDPQAVGVLVGGASITRARHGLSGGRAWVGEIALVSSNLNPCDMATATAVSVSVDITPGTSS